MHELGLIAEVVDTIEKVVKEEKVTSIATLVLNVGEYSGIVPQYLEECYPAVIEGTVLENAKLKLNIIPAKAVCHDCNQTFMVKGNEQACPFCKSQHCDVIEGAEFTIDSIVAN